MQKLITSSADERVTLADTYYHFLTLAPSPRKATIDLVSVIRQKQLELRSERIREYRPGETDPQTPKDQETIPAEALADPVKMTFDWEFSCATWKIRPQAAIS